VEAAPHSETPAAQREPMPLVWVVDDDRAVRTSLDRLLRSMAFRVETFASAREALDTLERGRPRCVVVDLAMPELSGLDFLHILLQRGEPIPVVFVSGEGNVGSSVEAMKDGAIDFLEKPADADALLAAVMRGLAREAEWRQSRARVDDAAHLLGALTPREREVMIQVASGRSNKQIAAELGTSEKTIKVHRGRVMHKLGAGSVVDVVHIAEQAGALSA
jgi:FixJ family two-component response regulator